MGFLANETTSVAHNSNLRKVPLVFRCTMFVDQSLKVVFKGVHTTFFFFPFSEKHFMSEAFTDINIRVILVRVRAPPSLVRQMQDLEQRRKETRCESALSC